MYTEKSNCTICGATIYIPTKEYSLKGEPIIYTCNCLDKEEER